MNIRREDDVAFVQLARLHPREAAEKDWPRFMGLCRELNPHITESEVKASLGMEFPLAKQAEGQ